LLSPVFISAVMYIHILIRNRSLFDMLRIRGENMVYDTTIAKSSPIRLHPYHPLFRPVATRRCLEEYGPVLLA
jgi:hypothetical protein